MRSASVGEVLGRTGGDGGALSAAGANIAGFKKVATAMMEQGCF